MKYLVPNPLQQVHLGIGPDCLMPVASYQGEKDIYAKEHELLQARILQLCPAHIWYHGSNELSCPRPILVKPQHQEQLSRLHNALVVAIADIVQRWWADPDARFPDRMPLASQEEQLLRVCFSLIASFLSQPTPQNVYYIC